MPRKIEISHKTIIFTILFLISLWFLYFIRDIILIFFISLLVMTILNPSVSKLSKFRIPRGLAVVIVYALLIGVLAGVIAGVLPPLVEQTTNFAVGLPKYLSNIGVSSVISEQIIREVVSRVGSLPEQILKIGFSLVSNIISVLTVLIFAFYLLIARNKLDDQIVTIFGDQKRELVSEVLNSLENRLGGWARGEMSLMVLVGILNFIGFTILGIPYALPLALLAGLFEIVPNIGPILAAIPAVIIGFGISPVIGLATIALAFFVQQVENYVFVPKVMEESVGVSPVVTLLALAIGFRLAGVIGILISVPVFLCAQVILTYYFARKD